MQAIVLITRKFGVNHIRLTRRVVILLKPLHPYVFWLSPDPEILNHHDKMIIEVNEKRCVEMPFVTVSPHNDFVYLPWTACSTEQTHTFGIRILELPSSRRIILYYHRPRKRTVTSAMFGWIKRVDGSQYSLWRSPWLSQYPNDYSNLFYVLLTMKDI
ncbi:hypothetical protein BDA99DRAFT_592306 [Phascolomyces articulosus]|uniref:Uncharacterized protein n=1 Tax=Phascolomyces articulosus TaxID=60185 RepID=A0AAD5K1D8_9FUNG|nr:hypothetical protein BDA99DRAFT_592306 [Phascolomyces articulosus]